MAQQNTFAKAFLPGLVIGLAVGLPVGAYLSGMSVPFIGSAPKQANGATTPRRHDERGSITDPAMIPPQAGENLLPRKDPINDKPIAPATPPAVDPAEPDGTPPAKLAEPAATPVGNPTPVPSNDPATPKKPVDPK